MGKNPQMPTMVSTLLKHQKGKCTHCDMYFRENDVMEVDHIIPKSKGGKEEYKNFQLLHRHCHDTKTAMDIGKAKAQLRQNVAVPGSKYGCNSAKPKPSKRLEREQDKWVMRYV
jgi:RNA-directed DNA polymerase